jgi:hypothetical protein
MKIHLTALTLGFLLLPVAAQAQTSTPPTPPCVDLSAKPAVQNGGFLHRAERVMGIDSSAHATASQNICPLSAGQKFQVWVRRSYSPVNFLAAAADAALWQATQPAREGGYGQGWDAYGSRFGASLADTETSRFFQTFLFPSLLHEDPRYFRQASGTTGHRFGYAISRVLVARTDDGRHRFNFSEVSGAFLSAALTNAYYPDADRNAPRTMRAAGMNLAASAGWNVFYEFGSDVLRKLKGKEKK